MSKTANWFWRITSVMMVFLMAFAPVFASPTAVAAQVDEPPAPRLVERADREAAFQVFSELEGQAAIEKIDPILREAAESGGKDQHQVYVSVMGEAKLDGLLTDAYARPAVFAGIRNVYGKATSSSLLKIAQEPGVLAIVSVGIELEKPYDPEVNLAPTQEEIAARMESLKANELSWEEAQAKAAEVGAQGWFDVQDGHKSSAAWDKGFTGEGVIVGVLDDGIDFGHPDLQGTYATVTDPESPYYGWPMAFSQVSLLYFFQDLYFDVSGIASGWGGSRWTDTQFETYASSSFEGGTDTVWYEPLGAEEAFEYTFPTNSQSNYYKLGSFPERNLLNLYGHRVAVLVVDEHSAGNYDTVYVDLDNDKDFTDEKPATQDSPEIYRDMDGDGYADISGGLLVWISDGDNVPPGADFLWGIDCSWSSSTMQGCPDSGELVLFAGPFDAGYTHGTQCASNIAGQGVVNEGLTAQPFRIGGMVQGGAPEVGLMDFGNHYYSGTDEDEFLMAALGYDGIPNSGDEVQITSNSYGAFRQMWGGWGYIGRLITAMNLTIAPSTVWVFSAGNEGPGYGPQEGDGGPTTIMAGSSTQYGSTNWDSIVDADQIMYGDPNSFFSKGPNRDGSSGLDVLGNGGRGAGDEGINYYGYNGAESWATWGGTSRSSPVVAGNLALVYQAYHERYGEYPTWEMAKALLKSGATNSVSSPFFQGGGVVNADRATDLAAGIYGVYAMPDEWQVGDWEGEQYLNFAKVAVPGETYTTTYSVYNPSGYDITVDLSDGVMTLLDSYELEFTTSDESEESSFNFHTPDYLLEMDPETIPEDAELMVVRYVHSYDSFDPVYDFTANPNSSWRFMVYNWTDVNGDGMLWEDANGNGTVNHADSDAMDNDGFYRPDFANSEIQEGEYVRVDYEFGGLAVPVAIRNPLERMADGYFFGWQHRSNDHTISQTTFKIGVEFYKRADWAWLSLSDDSLDVPAEDMATFVATVDLPEDAAAGAYEGVIYMNDPGDPRHAAHESALPVVINVIADLPDGGAMTLGGGEMADTLYQNSYTHGMFNWYGGGWTGAGDWRHYFLNFDEADVDSGSLLVHTSWDAGYPTDINTWLLGPTYDCASNGVGPCAWFEPGLGQPDPYVFGPYTLQPIGSSEPFRSGATYPFDTSTGGSDDWIRVDLEMAGLHELALHNVLYDGEELAAQFQVDIGTVALDATMDPADGTVEVGSVNADAYTDNGEIELSFTPTIEVPDLHATLTGGLAFDHMDDESFVTDTGGCYSAWCAGNVYEYINVNQIGATQLSVHLHMPSNQDADLFLVYDANGNSIPEEGVDPVVGSSGNSTGTDEHINISNPTLGGYFVTIDGYDVDPDSGVTLEWYWEVTYPGPLPTEVDEVYSDTVSIEQDDIFDPTSASYSMTVTTDERSANLHVLLSGIPSGNDVDLYVSDEDGNLIASQLRGSVNEHIIITPEPGEYRLGEGREYTIWVHGYAVAGTITPHLRVWWDVLNLWLSTEHEDVSVSAIEPGESATFTLHFEKEGWVPGDSPLSARLLASPSVLEGAYDELVTIYRTEPPVDPGPQPDAGFYKWTESTRGPSPFWVNGYPTVLANTGDVLTATLHIENTGEITGTFYAEDWIQRRWEILDSFVYTDTQVYVCSDCFSNGTWDIIYYWVELAPGESSDIVYTADFNNNNGGTGWAVANYLDVYNADTEDYYGGDINIAYIRSFRMDGSYKMSDPPVVGPGDEFTYMVSLQNPSSIDREVFVVDYLPEEVTLVDPGPMTYDADNHLLTWDGWLYGSTLESVDFGITVMANADLDEGTWFENMITISDKYFGTPFAYLYADTYVDDGLDPDLVIEKTVDRLYGPVGTMLEYTIVLENTGTEDAFDTAIYDMVPAELTVDMDSLTGGATYEDGMITWMGDVPAGESVSFGFTATINESATPDLALINAAWAMAENFVGRTYNSAVTEVVRTYSLIMPLIIK